MSGAQDVRKSLPGELFSHKLRDGELQFKIGYSRGTFPTEKSEGPKALSMELAGSSCG